jgi:hypothetical protein
LILSTHRISKSLQKLETAWREAYDSHYMDFYAYQTQKKCDLRDGAKPKRQTFDQTIFDPDDIPSLKSGIKNLGEYLANKQHKKYVTQSDTAKYSSSIKRLSHVEPPEPRPLADCLISPEPPKADTWEETLTYKYLMLNIHEVCENLISAKEYLACIITQILI